MTEKKKELTPAQQYHKALHAMPSAIAFNASVSYKQTHFKFVNFKALRDAVLPILDKHDLSVRYKTMPSEGLVVLVGEIVHKDGEILNTFALPLRTSGKPQDLGSEITYFKRYALAALTGVVSDEDDDGNFADKAEAEREAQEKTKKKEKLKGPLQRTALDGQLRLYLTAMIASTSIEEFDQAAKDYAAPLKQMKEQWAEWWTEFDGERTESYKKQYADQLARLKVDEEIMEQQEQDMRPPQ